MREHHVVVVGGGFGGLQVVHGLEGASDVARDSAPVRITLIDRRNHHLFQPLLYQVATTALATSEIAWPIRRLYRDRPEVTTLLAEVAGVDREKRTVLLKTGETIGYDTLVLATGAGHAYFGNDHWESAAPGLKTLEDATTIRRRLLLAFERAELAQTEEGRDAHLTFVVIGGGPTGVETAGMIADLAKTILPKEFRNVDTKDSRVLLVEAGKRVLPVFSEDLSDYAARALERLGVEVMLGEPVTDITAEGVRVGETFIPARTVVWAAGVQASPAGRWLEAATDKAGRVIIGRNLTLDDDPQVFVIGDTASVVQTDGKPVPGIAPAAKQQGAFVAKMIRARLAGKPEPEAFVYRHMGNLATIGKRAAVIEYGRFKLKGGLAWWIWGIAHIYFLIGARSRLAVAWSWLWIYLSGQHSARLITQKETVKDNL